MSKRSLPDRLTISLWDFSWYTRTGPGEPFADLDKCFADARARGYNTVRICAMPYLLFGSGLPTSALTFKPLGGGYGMRTRWYDVAETVTLDGRAHLRALFEAARRHDFFVILSSWEYQQSPCFLADTSWADAMFAVSPEDRPAALADALADLVDYLVGAGLADRVAYVELHNEVATGRLTDAVSPGIDPLDGLRPLLEAAAERFRSRHPHLPVTANYAGVPAGRMRALPGNLDVAAFHPYVYGVLGELVETFALRDEQRPFPADRARAELLRADAPTLEEWAPPGSERARLAGTIMSPRELFVHDWCDPAAWDRWLYERYGAHRLAMDDRLSTWLAVADDWARSQGVPLVLGEGWVGYTPLLGTFEEGPVGAAICARAVWEAARLGAWGTVVCSNAAPHHPMWADTDLQRRLNADFARTTR